MTLLSFNEWKSGKQEESVVVEKTVNDITEPEWLDVPGIGPTLAKRIVESGPYDNIDEVANVKGIRPSVFEALKELLN